MAAPDRSDVCRPGHVVRVIEHGVWQVVERLVTPGHR